MTQVPLPDFSNTEIAFASKSLSDLKQTYRLFSLMNSPWIVKYAAALGVTAVRWRLPLAERIVYMTIYKQFCGGRDILECQPVIDRLAAYGASTILDYGAEAKDTDEAFDETKNETLRAIDFAASNTSVPVVSTKMTGLAAYDLLAKIQRDETLTASEQAALDRVRARLFEMADRASARGVGIMVDAEETWIQEVIDDLVEDLMERYNTDRVVIYQTYQMYRKDKLADLHRAYERAKIKGYLLGAKLVRGAYMNKEHARAVERGYDSPIQATKADTDKDYDEAIRFCVDHHEDIAVCNASHNQASMELMAELISSSNIRRDHRHLNFCQLYGMSDHLTFNLAASGFNVAKYVPYGPVKEVMPYLVRRAQENSSVTGEMSRELGYVKRELLRRRS